jgi:hypothetical protein
MLRHEVEDRAWSDMILCIVGIEIVLRLLLLSTLLRNSLKLSVVVVGCCCEEQIVIGTTVHQSKLMLVSIFRVFEDDEPVTIFDRVDEFSRAADALIERTTVDREHTDKLQLLVKFADMTT